MKTFLTERVYSGPNEIAEEHASGAFPRSEDEGNELAARLACWVAGEADAFVNIDDEDDWPLIALMAELAAMAMLAQHRAEQAARGIEEVST